MKTRIFCTLALAIPHLLLADCPPTGLIALWQGQSNILDSIGNYDAVSKGSGVTYVTGEVGAAFTFNGTSAATINVGPFADFGTNDFTVEFWIKTTDNSFDEIISKRDLCMNTAQFFDIRMKGNGTIDFGIGGGNPTNGARDFTSIKAINDGTWHHVAAVRQQSNALLYIDGAFDTSQSQDAYIANITNSADLKIGGGPCVNFDGTTWLSGKLDEISIYTRALSASEVGAVYSAGSSGKCCWAARVSKQPVTPQNVHAGGNTSFTVTALGSPAPSYQWRLNGANIVGATTSVYSLVNAQSGNVGTYTVVATNACGTDTSDGTSVLAFAPVVTTQPANATGVLGSPAYFSAVVSGTPTITYQWRKNGTAINDGATYTGTQTAALTITTVAGGSAGSYSVHVANDGGSVNSGNGILSVPPQITVQPTSKSAFVSNNVVFAVTATGSPTLTYQWMTNGVNVPGATTASYTVSSVNSNWNGLAFSVKVSNAYGNVTSDGTATLSLKGTVLVDIPTPLKTTNCPGDTRTLCVTGGAAAGYTPGYQWRHSGTAITGATASCYTVNVTDSSAAGSYSVVVSDPFGSDTSSTAIIAYATPAAITLAPQSTTVSLGNPALFLANALGSKPITYSWIKDGTSVVATGVTNYAIASVAAGDAGSYVFQAANQCYSANSTPPAVLTVNTPNCASNLVDSSLVAWWKFENDVVDAVSNYNGTAVGMTYGAGKVDSGIIFDGTTNYSLSFSTNAGNFGTSDFTVEFWMKTSSLADMKFIAKSCSTPGWQFRISQDTDGAFGHVTFECWATGNHFGGTEHSYTLCDGQWHHLAATRAGLNISMYVDGQFQADASGSTSAVANVDSTWQLKMGRDDCGSAPFNGMLDEVGFFNRALSATEISQIYNASYLGLGNCGP